MEGGDTVSGYMLSGTLEITPASYTLEIYGYNDCDGSAFDVGSNDGSNDGCVVYDFA